MLLMWWVSGAPDRTMDASLLPERQVLVGCPGLLPNIHIKHRSIKHTGLSVRIASSH